MPEIWIRVCFYCGNEFRDRPPGTTWERQDSDGERITDVLKKLGMAAVAAMVIGTGTAQAVPISFTQITANGNQSVASQLMADLITGTGLGQVQFVFTNTAVIASSITEVYFDDDAGVLGSPIAALIQSAGVDFGLTSGNLPGGNQPAIAFSATAGADANGGRGGVMEHGINASSESLSVVFNLVNGRTFTDVLDAVVNRQLRLGLHVQAISPIGGSESFVNSQSGTSVPEPTSMLLLGTGLLGLAGVARRRKK